MRRAPPRPSFEDATAAFRRAGGLLRAREAKAAGIHPRTLTEMADNGALIRMSRGVYQLSGATPAQQDLAIVALKVPSAVICLVSALAIHKLTTQIPRAVDLAVPRGFGDRKFEHPPVRYFRFSDGSLAAGIERPRINGREMRVFGAAKTVADCFKFRNKIGGDIAVEALRLYVRRRGAKVSELLEFARINRVQAVIAPYLDALL